MAEQHRYAKAPSRRAVFRAGAWSAPIAAVAVSAPALAVSPGPVPNTDANYYWDESAGSTFLKVDPATSGLRFQVSTQISYKAEPWTPPPSDAQLQIVIELSSPATLTSPPGGSWTVTPDVGSTATTFTFVRSTAGFGDGLTASFQGTEAGNLTVKAVMSVINPGTTTWAEEPATDEGELVA